MADAALSVRNLTKEFAGRAGNVVAVRNVSFDVAGGEFFTMLGPSGCGKTTTLRMIAGLEKATSGDIEVDGRDLRSVPPERRNIGMVFQSYALFPHLTVFENVAYGLRLRGQSGHEIDRRVARNARAAAAGSLLRAASGRPVRRTATARVDRRALVYEPTMLLLDEPLANLDAKLRVMMREEIRALQRRLGITTLYVTHDQEEATAVSDRLAVFDGGRLIQAGTPEEIYSRPRTLFVADFIGRANFLPARLEVPEVASGRCRAGGWHVASAAARGASRGRRSGVAPRLTGWHRHDPSGARCAQCDRRRQSPVVCSAFNCWAA
jgi:iron(III) transport system ATP-binding protein